jgi:cytochrome c oxidase assembly protein subunit 15
MWWFRARRQEPGSLLGRVSWLPVAVVLLQVTLGVLTLLGSQIHIPVDLAVAHQFCGMLLLETFFLMLYILRPARAEASPARSRAPRQRVAG